MLHKQKAFLTTVVIFVLTYGPSTALINGQEIASDQEYSTTDGKGDGTLNAMKAGPTSEPKTRPCNSCEMEKCRLHCKGTCRHCQYHFCHVNDGEYSCKCLRNRPAGVAAHVDEVEESGRRRRSVRMRRVMRVSHYLPPRRGRRVCNCHKQ
ncbi:uncharacterized protein LOC111267931 [Varroa jacobsoni]|uniref:uncharacterized protein LOC111267931 n=1 Tax=Varroa jacobsoni TaxID=62625 RepID=UPI000BF7F405|nr:uncharacterized protein LOC111267931 [Varroa jacobsoni]XP_022702266.1 uncharacterized protein LOC111267931 [Varroa jacobsoni]